MATAKFITVVPIRDPDNGLLLGVSIYKDNQSKELFGLTSSFIAKLDIREVPSPFNSDETLELLD